MLTYETIFNNMVPEKKMIIKNTQPKPVGTRISADLSNTDCYLCLKQRGYKNPTYEVVPGRILQIKEDGRVEVEIIYKVRNHKDYRVKEVQELYPDEFGSTPEQAVENKV